jgi:ethanolamine permease
LKYTSIAGDFRAEVVYIPADFDSHKEVIVEMLNSLFGRFRKIAPGHEATNDHPSTSSDSSDDIDIKGDQFPAMTNSKLSLRWWDLWALGVSTAVGGHFYFWNIPYLSGFGHFIIAYFLIASAYGTLALCMAELSSALPFAGNLLLEKGVVCVFWRWFLSFFSLFAGGAYGIARVTLGTVAGFVVGCFDVYQSMFNALYSAVAIGGALTMVYGTERRWLPVYWVTVLASYLILHIIGGVWMWRLLKFMTFFSILMIFIYIFGSIQFADFEENAPLWFPFGLEGKFQYFHGGVDLFLDILPFTCWMFAGTESVNLAAHDCVNPKRDVPRGYILTWITIFCTSIGCVFIGASVFPGATLIAYYFFPTSVAYAQIFNISILRATALSIPAIYTTGFGFTYYYGSQVRAMGKSGLANPWLGYDVPGFKTPIVALVFGFVVCMLVGLRYYWWKELKGESLLGISLMGASVVYCTQFISYIVLRLYYPTIKREFESPLGLIGAVYGLCVFLLVFIILACLESQLAIKAFSIYLGVILLYYFLVVRHRQVFSEEEKTVLFKAYLLKSKSSGICVFISERNCNLLRSVVCVCCRQPEQEGETAHRRRAFKLPPRRLRHDGG